MTFFNIFIASFPKILLRQWKASFSYQTCYLVTRRDVTVEYSTWIITQSSNRVSFLRISNLRALCEAPIFFYIFFFRSFTPSRTILFDKIRKLLCTSSFITRKNFSRKVALKKPILRNAKRVTMKKWLKKVILRKIYYDKLYVLWHVKLMIICCVSGRAKEAVAERPGAAGEGDGHQVFDWWTEEPPPE